MVGVGSEMSDLGSWADSSRGTWGPLADSLVALAETVEHGDLVDTLLSEIAVGAVDTIGGVDYASITAWRGAGYTTVAASSELARAVDDAQYGEKEGPCVQAAETGAPVGVPDVAATMSWPQFYRRASEFGLRTAVSVPLFAGGGTPVGVLNLYSREAQALDALMAGVRDVFAAEGLPAGDFAAGADLGSRQFLTGLGRALQIRVVIQQAIGVLMASGGGDAERAYRTLWQRAVEAGMSLSAAARSMVG